MNPVDWLKGFYEIFGLRYPRASLIAVMIVGAIFSGAMWLFAAHQVEKDQQTKVATPSTGAASSSGPNSPANTGTGNEFKYDQTPSQQTPAPKKSIP